MSQGLVFMGGSLSPRNQRSGVRQQSRHEFNLWFDPEAAHIVLRAHWPSIVCTTVDVSVKTQLKPGNVRPDRQIASPAAQYIARYSTPARSYLWDELASGGVARPDRDHRRKAGLYGYESRSRRGLWRHADLV